VALRIRSSEVKQGYPDSTDLFHGVQCWKCFGSLSLIFNLHHISFVKVEPALGYLFNGHAASAPIALFAAYPDRAI